MEIYTIFDSTDFWIPNKLTIEKIIDFVDKHIKNYPCCELDDFYHFNYINAYHEIICTIKGCTKNHLKIFLTKEEFEEYIKNSKKRLEILENLSK